MRIFAESIAFYNGVDKELRNILHTLDTLVEDQREKLRASRPVDAFNCSFSYLPFVLPTLILGRSYFNDTVKIGVLTQATSAFGILLNNLSMFIHDYKWYVFLVTLSIPKCLRRKPILRHPDGAYLALK